MSQLIQDLRYAARTFSRRPGFSAIVVLTLALGIGANTAIFSVVNAVLLSPLPFTDPGRLFVIWASNPELARSVGLPDELPTSPAQFYDWQEQSRSFERVGIVDTARVILTGQAEPEMLDGINVTGDLFEALGTAPILGRTIQPADDAPGRPAVVALSYKLWQRRFNGDPKIVGKTVSFDGAPAEIVGVMPAEFAFPRGAEMPAGYGFAAEPEFWRPMAFTEERRQHRMNHSYLALGRLRAGATPELAQAELDTISRRLAQQYPDTDKGWSARLEPLANQLVGGVRPALLILLGAVGVVLLIACANVANLFLAQAAGRQKEVAIRTALGAGRGRMIRQLLTESFLLSGLGGILGLLAAYWGLQAFAAWIPSDMPVPRTVAIDGAVLAFNFGLALLTGALAGLAPALQTTGPDLAESLREGTRGGSSSARGRRTRSALVVAEVSLALLLVIGAGLLIRSFVSLTSIDPGFHSEGALTFEVALPNNKYPRERRAAFYEQVIERVGALPGVTSAGAVSNLPMSGTENIEALLIEGQPRPEAGKLNLADLRLATPGYFATMGIPLLSGRGFGATDTADSTKVAVIDEVMARTYWPSADPLGKRFRMGGPDDADAPLWTVVGVVGNVRHSGLHVEKRPQMYLSQTQRSSSTMTLVVRTSRDPMSLGSAARSAVYAVDRDQPVTQMRTLEQVVSSSVAGRRFNMVLLGFFAGLALVLAAIGIYGVTAYSVSQRTREMGLRMALGAQPGQVLRMVVGEAGKLALAGVLLGLALAFAGTRVMASLLFGVKPVDPITYAGVSLGLALIALTAAYLPGRKATVVDPMVALRRE